MCMSLSTIVLGSKLAVSIYILKCLADLTKHKSLIRLDATRVYLSFKNCGNVLKVALKVLPNYGPGNEDITP